MSMKEITREPLHEKLLELSKAKGHLKALEYFNDKDMMKKTDTERILKDALDKIENVSQYILYNYQQLKIN
jgi:hypothetical protein